ncbi:TetR/AcrR family transcriptional regulator [Paenibacillus sp. GSMTC-2017]|uniref:TetR/AcrR family transcriptional regulator n=1 Tax=Paenibacillus sp. GSMTC-2017 TaxID=2794350 RepID=UPI0018D84B26|nr:TetR family transcriptional regulator C-terminal domain-containing protein [Paenibacillus sp. GSMTC-2017]MBH5318437.1 TetR/AcrR family transcriptional regulator [Paenibacillus sp. GSMTC-2017]
MPKIVNHETQREMIAEVAWTIVTRDGVESASVRNIAKEAGLSMGSMRHYFPSQADLYIYLMELVSNRVGARVQAMIASTTTPTFEQLTHLMMQLLPIHEETKPEMEVWLWFNAKAVSTPALKPLNARIYEETFLLVKLVIDALIHMKLAKQEIDVHYEAQSLYALVDGLAIHCFMHPDEASEERISSILTRHLQDLCER